MCGTAIHHSSLYEKVQKEQLSPIENTDECRCKLLVQREKSVRISKICVICGLFFALLTACGAAQPVLPTEAQARVQSAWRADMHGVWELQWRQMPLDGSVVFEGWMTMARAHQRLEILEAPSPALVGLVYVNDGSAAVIFNRLERYILPVHGDGSLPFSPITDVLTLIDRVLAQTPQTVSVQKDGLLVRYTFGWADGQSAQIWLDEQSARIARVEIRTADDAVTLAARTVSPLKDEPPALFAVPGEN